MKSTKFAIYAAAVVTVLAPVSPAFAGDDAEKTGLIAGLGLAAADGKTTISEDGGGIEASLLVSKAIDKAGLKVADIAKREAPTGPILVLAKDDETNLIVLTMGRRRLAGMLTALASRKCPGGKADGTFKALIDLAGSDPIAAVVTSTNYAPVPVSFSDRMLLSAVAARDARFVLPNEIIAIDKNSSILAGYDTMRLETARLRRCGKSEADKNLVETADALAASLDASEGTKPSALIAAAQLESLYSVDGPPPSVLRLAIEQQGGTAITRSNIWYTLGFPGAAKISAGLIVSYRLARADKGTLTKAGYVLCAIAPVDISVVAKVALDTSETARPKIQCEPFPT